MKTVRRRDRGRNVPCGIAAWLLTLLTILCAGCAHPPTISTATRAAVYERANLFFDQTALLKPAQSDQPGFKFAPLLVQETLSTNASWSAPESVYFWRTQARDESRVLEQFNYLWFLADNERHLKIAQGVRITFNPAGEPIVWEILRDPSQARILFVCQSLEAAAMTNHPTPLPGRRFWVERSVDDTPAVVVARIIDESSVAMGPILYLESDSHNVSTLICRCMDAQAKEVVRQGTYELVPLDDVAVRWLKQDPTRGITRWLPGRRQDDLAQWLRMESH